MKRIIRNIILLSLLLATFVSCSDKAKLIPTGKMEKIYAEMFLADQWLADVSGMRTKADTSWFYEPIFEKYGYTVEDYRKTVKHLLNDPDRYCDMMSRVENSLTKESDRLSGELSREKKLRHRLDSLAKARREFRPTDLSFLGFYRDYPSSSDSLKFVKDSTGAYKVVVAQRDTFYSGPSIIVRGSLATYDQPVDTVSTVKDSVDLHLKTPLKGELQRGEISDGDKEIQKMRSETFEKASKVRTR